MKRGVLTCDQTLGVDCLEAWVALPHGGDTPSWIYDAAMEHLRRTPDDALTGSLVGELV